MRSNLPLHIFPLIFLHLLPARELSRCNLPPLKWQRHTGQTFSHQGHHLIWCHCSIGSLWYQNNTRLGAVIRFAWSQEARAEARLHGSRACVSLIWNTWGEIDRWAACKQVNNQPCRGSLDMFATCHLNRVSLCAGLVRYITVSVHGVKTERYNMETDGEERWCWCCAAKRTHAQYLNKSVQVTTMTKHAITLLFCQGGFAIFWDTLCGPRFTQRCCQNVQQFWNEYMIEGDRLERKCQFCYITFFFTINRQQTTLPW